MQAPWASSRPSSAVCCTSGLCYGGSGRLDAGCGGVRRSPPGLSHSHLVSCAVGIERQGFSLEGYAFERSDFVN
jgi:hypothetical protein